MPVSAPTNKKPKPMAYGGGPFGLPDEEYDLRFPQMPDEMDPTALPPMPRPPAELSRFDAEPMPEMGGSPQAPPQMDALMADEDRSMRDTAPLPMGQMGQMGQQAPPPMGRPLRNQGTAQQEAIDYAKTILDDPKHPGQFKRPSILQEIGEVLLPGMNLHPRLSREYQNYNLLKSRADEERKMQQAQANEQIKNDTLATNAAYRNNALASKGTTTRLTGDAQKVSLLEEGYSKQPGVTPEQAREYALRDYKAEFTFPKGEWSKVGIIADPESSTGYSARMYNRRTSETKVEKDIIPGLGYFGSTTETTSPKLVPQANGDIATVDTTTSVRRTPNIPGSTPGGNPLGVQPMLGGNPPMAPEVGQPAPAPPATPRIVGHRTPKPPAASRPQTFAIPDGKGGFKLQTFGPGDIIPPGAVNSSGVNRANTTAAEAGELTPAGQTQMKEVDVVTKQFDALLKKLEPYKANNNPLALSGAMANYKLGRKSPEGELGNEISNLSLASIQGMMPFASKSRNYQFIKDIGQHLPHLNVVGGDSPALIYDKLSKARANFEGMRKAIARYEVKHAKADAAPAATGTPATADEYLKSIGHQ